MRIDDTTFSSQFGEIRERRAAMAARAARLEAEARGSELVFPPELLADAASPVRSEKCGHDARARKFEPAITTCSPSRSGRSRSTLD